MYKRLFFIFLVLIFSQVKGQENMHVTISWETPKEIVFAEKKIIIPCITDQNFDLKKPNFYWLTKIQASISSTASIISYQTGEALVEEINYLQNEAIKVPEVLAVDMKVTRGGKDVFAVANLFPFIREDGVIKRILSFDVYLDTKKTSPSVNHQKSTVASSVLACGSGIWYKVAVNSDGIYKIDKTFLEACGISTSGLNPSSINMYGNGDGKLPELNSETRTDDLAKNAIYIHGEADGVFDDTDYILFYGWGPSRWSSDGIDEFNQDKNIYSDASYYFININSSNTPLRISEINSSTLPITHLVTSYSYFDTHESDLVSLFSGGQRWYGELFDTNLDQTFSFSVPNIDVSTSAKFKVSMASNSGSGSGTSQVYKINGTTIGSSILPVGNFGRTEVGLTVSIPTSSLPLEVIVTRNSPSVSTYLDKITLNARRNLVFTGSQFNFRDLKSKGASNVGDFTISNFGSTYFVWDITDRHNPKKVNGVYSGSAYTFQLEVDSLREFVASNASTFMIPGQNGFVDCQNLHALEQADYLIITHSDFVTQAERLANLHRANGLKVHVATTDQVYNEFSSGMLDPTAIRSFGKMFYDRSSSMPGPILKYVLLFGDGTFDPKNRVPNNNNYIPTYQVLNSEDHISAMVSDDYYGFFDPAESMQASDLLDIGIGRLLISDNTMAQQQVDKIEHYLKNGSNLFSSSTTNCSNSGGNGSSTFGDWRLKTTMIADDEESGYFVLQDGEPNSQYIQVNSPEMNVDKIYLDAYPQISTAGGQRYPEVYDAITDRVERGTLVLNYVGHGGETGAAEERVIRIPQLQSWKNIDKLNLMVTATCEFTKYDDPSRVSAGEWVSLNPYGGAIALMTTTRSVYFGVNTITGAKFYENVFSRDIANKPLTFGEIIQLTKNTSGSSDNKRSFTLIGDPALRIALPEMNIVTDSVNSLSPSLEIDTIRALSKMTIKGHIEDFSSNILTDFNGVLSPTVYDKAKSNTTLGQDSDSPILSFELQKNALYKGKATVTNGYFEFSFIVPKDITYTYGNGKIGYYAENKLYDASGQDTRIIIGGIDPVGIKDELGPDIKLYLNDQNFAKSGMTDETPLLLADIFDENGINTVGNGVGHDLLAVLDGNTANPIVLNEYYSSNLDSYQSGKIEYNFSKLEKGRHTLSLKVWDVNNNSSEVSIDFTVQEKEELSLDHVLNYPNPFTTKTEFYFEHNQICTDLEVQIQIFTVSGKLVKTINQLVLTEGFRSEGISWNGLDDFGDQLAKGVYIYLLKVKSPDGKVAEKIEKLVILK